MTAVYFVIAAVALVGAGGLLWLDRRRAVAIRRERAQWGDGHGFVYAASPDDRDTRAPNMRTQLQRATMDVADDVEIRDIASGRYYGEQVVVFDLGETATIAAIRRSSQSSVVIDLRQEKVLAPAEDDVELLGAMGRRVMFASHLDIARRVCDRRMVALAGNAPDYIEILWNEGTWSVASMPVTTDPTRLDTALETVRRFNDLLRVLPPAADPAPRPDPRDPSAPSGRGRRGLAEPKTEAILRQELSAEPSRPDPTPSSRSTPSHSVRSDSNPSDSVRKEPEPRTSGVRAPGHVEDARRGVTPMPVRRRVDRASVDDEERR